LKCASTADAFDVATRAFKPSASTDGCYPLTLTANVIFHHSYADLKKYCFVDDETGAKGTGVPAVQFWKWMFESGINVETAIVRSKAVPLLHTVNNSAQVKAASWMTDSIQCGHPPDVVEVDNTRTYIIAGAAGGCALIILAIIAWLITARHAWQVNPLKGVNVLQVVKDVHKEVLPMTDGQVATYIPELGKVDPALFGICIVTVNGEVYKYGDVDYEFSIQSMSKPLGYAQALEERGFDYVETKVNVEPAGGAFDTMELDSRNRPFNPFINSGAIAIAMQLAGDMHQRYESFRELMSGFCNREVRLDDNIYKCESATGARNRAIADKLASHGICNNEYDKEHGLVRQILCPNSLLSSHNICRSVTLTRAVSQEAYFMMCSTLHNAVDLATLAATCANHGVNPISKKQIISNAVNEKMMRY